MGHEVVLGVRPDHHRSSKGRPSLSMRQSLMVRALASDKASYMNSGLGLRGFGDGRWLGGLSWCCWR